jgi:Xaa-Pro aminopeptidase
MIKEKIKQAFGILREEDMDCWLTFIRESSTVHDPVIDLIVGPNVTWHSAFILTSKGESIAIVGSLDKANQEDHGNYETIIGYLKSIEEDLIKTLNKINPNKIALNYSLNSPTADGLTYGMYQQLMKYLNGTPFASRIVSSEPLINKLRGRKSQTEIERVKKSINLTLDLFDRVGKFIKAGRTEKEVAQFLIDQVEKEGVELAWEKEHCPAVFTGPDTAGAHAGPTNREVKHGHVLNIDFGVKIDDYCSDLQRSWYILKPGETEAPAEVKHGFKTIEDSITKAAAALKPGVTGYEIDTIARNHIVEQGYEEYPHALGHQIGRVAHDGGGLLSPKWERYGTLPDQIVEESQLYTIEPRLPIKDYGIATVEEIVVITKDGCEFLSPRQKEIFLVQP